MTSAERIQKVAGGRRRGGDDQIHKLTSMKNISVTSSKPAGEMRAGAVLDNLASILPKTIDTRTGVKKRVDGSLWKEAGSRPAARRQESVQEAGRRQESVQEADMRQESVQ